MADSRTTIGEIPAEPGLKTRGVPHGTGCGMVPMAMVLNSVSTLRGSSDSWRDWLETVSDHSFQHIVDETRLSE